MGRWRRATPYFPHFELASTIFFFLSLRILSCFYNRSFFLFFFNSLIQLYIRFFLPSHYELILSYLYFVFFVPSLSLLLFSRSSTISSSSLLEISMLESYILFPSSFVLHQGSFFSLFLSSLSSNARMLECYDASRCRYTFFPPPLARTRLDGRLSVPLSVDLDIVFFFFVSLHPLSSFGGDALYSRRVFIPPPGKFLLVSIFGKLPYPRALQFSPCFFFSFLFFTIGICERKKELSK